MDAKDVLPILFERSNAAAALWNFQLSVLFALLAFLGAVSNLWQHKVVLLGLTLAYALFAIINWKVLLQVEAQRAVLAAYISPRLPPEIADCR
jgi:hypothetical protein